MVDLLKFLKDYSYDHTYLTSIFLHFEDSKDVVTRELVKQVSIGNIEIDSEQKVGNSRLKRLRNDFELRRCCGEKELFIYKKR